MTFDEAKLRRLHANGLSDRAIGEQMGCSAFSVMTARRKLGLLPSRDMRRAAGQCEPSLVDQGKRRAEKSDAKLHGKSNGRPTLFDSLWERLSLDDKADLMVHLLTREEKEQ